MRILIVEDEYNLADAISERLKKEKYSVDISLDGEDGLYKALTNAYDLICLDVMLPYKDGFEILKEIKKNNIDSKVIMLTAKSELDNKLEGFNNGVDDYITKPFHIEELIARINVQIRKNDNINKDEISYGDLVLNIRTTKLLCTTTKEEIDIVYKELMILEYLMNNPNQVISKNQLYDKVWGIDNSIESNNLEAYISFIRKKIKIIGSCVNIKSNRRLGYNIEVNDEKIK